MRLHSVAHEWMDGNGCQAICGNANGPPKTTLLCRQFASTYNSETATDTIDYVATDQNGLTATSTRTVIHRAGGARFAS